MFIFLLKIRLIFIKQISSRPRKIKSAFAATLKIVIKQVSVMLSTYSVDIVPSVDISLKHEENAFKIPLRLLIMVIILCCYQLQLRSIIAHVYRWTHKTTNHRAASNQSTSLQQLQFQSANDDSSCSCVYERRSSTPPKLHRMPPGCVEMPLQQTLHVVS